ncbi:MAG: DUF2309 domain-containing protein [Planctomycetota bacterium]|nr:DUF2309 domain-containing protein [Planctomycetota bacterium]
MITTGPGAVDTADEQLREQVIAACNSIAQSWPMKTFAYRNPLRGWESLPFDEAVSEGRQLIGGNGYLSNEDYRRLYREGRIADDAIEHALRGAGIEAAAEAITLGNRRIEFWEVLRLHLLFGFDPLDPALLTWQVSAGPLQRDLWQSSLTALGLSDAVPGDGDQGHSADTSADIDLPAGQTLSDWLDKMAGASLVDQINDQMIKWNAAFLDEGMAGWQMPGREAGFYASWRQLAQRDFSARFQGIKKFASKCRALPDSPADAIATHLTRLEIPPDRWPGYMARLFAQLPGWVGFIRWRSENPHYAAQTEHPMDPVEYLAVRLFYEVELVEAFCQGEWASKGTLSALRSHWEQHPVNGAHPADAVTQAICRDGWRCYQLARRLRLTPQDVQQLPASDIKVLLGWLDVLSADRHGPVWLSALERTFRDRLLGRLAAHQGPPPGEIDRPLAQLVMCIDTRSESFRRHIEATGPYETLGYAGFFGVAMSHQAFDDSERAALCPVIVAPGFEVTEVPRSDQEQSLKQYASGSRWHQLGQHLFHDLKSNPIGSFMLIDLLGLFYTVRLIGKTFLQTPYEAIKTTAANWFARPVATHIPVDQTEPAADAALAHGFTPDEQATFVEKGLRAIGLTENFGRFIVACGHGSTSENNPYFAAYNCGACGGGHGDPNARVFARMGNQLHVRRVLKENGLEIPDDTWFLAAKHNTATDRVSFYDEQDVPASHTADLHRFKKDLIEAGREQALERCQRTPAAPTSATPQGAARHLAWRTIDWANVRPEWGLSSNAAFILGRRTLTKGLDLGGRVFLHSYNPDIDTEGDFLEALMNAPLVVAQWISMEYYFSAVDPVVYGSGSKVTHNVVSGVGVMHGSHGDLQAGLPLQSVNNGARRYHEPVRLLAIIDAPTSRISAVIDKHTTLQHLFHNQWVNLVAYDPDSGGYCRYRPDATWEVLDVPVA